MFEVKKIRSFLIIICYYYASRRRSMAAWMLRSFCHDVYICGWVC